MKPTGTSARSANANSSQRTIPRGPVFEERFRMADTMTVYRGRRAATDRLGRTDASGGPRTRRRRAGAKRRPRACVRGRRARSGRARPRRDAGGLALLVVVLDRRLVLLADELDQLG